MYKNIHHLLERNLTSTLTLSGGATKNRAEPSSNQQSFTSSVALDSFGREVAEQVSIVEDEVKIKSVYVRNVPSIVSSSVLEERLGENVGARVATIWIRQMDVSVVVTLVVAMVTTTYLEVTELDTIDQVNVKNEYFHTINKCQEMATTLRNERLLDVFVTESQRNSFGQSHLIQHIYGLVLASEGHRTFSSTGGQKVFPHLGMTDGFSSPREDIGLFLTSGGQRDFSHHGRTTSFSSPMVDSGFFLTTGGQRHFLTTGGHEASPQLSS
ncbi:hypothetical protein POM88_026389 [Heracleum sosnowskyi]|uniref:Uncharacterized protein n=1 Tax=Heracleum sosnowskyi TaxID=360622 RepID=A0AAD8I910_9APIA|nr:hypothetical protein POM88_026389 [Heracleum sosnowskyi]